MKLQNSVLTFLPLYVFAQETTPSATPRPDEPPFMSIGETTLTDASTSPEPTTGGTLTQEVISANVTEITGTRTDPTTGATATGAAAQYSAPIAPLVAVVWAAFGLLNDL